MKIKIKGLAVAAAMLLSATAMADSSYLYWMSSGTSLYGDSWSYAKVAYTTDDGATVNYLGAATGGDQFAEDLRFGNDFYSMQVSIGSLTLGNSYKFALELYDSGNNLVSSSALFGDGWKAYDAGYIGGGSFSAKEAAFAFYQVPEPTSGLLATLGFGLLALRRKQKKA